MQVILEQNKLYEQDNMIIQQIAVIGACNLKNTGQKEQNSLFYIFNLRIKTMNEYEETDEGKSEICKKKKKDVDVNSDEVVDVIKPKKNNKNDVTVKRDAKSDETKKKDDIKDRC